MYTIFPCFIGTCRCYMPWPRCSYDKGLVFVLWMIKDLYRCEERIEIDMKEYLTHGFSVPYSAPCISLLACLNLANQSVQGVCNKFSVVLGKSCMLSSALPLEKVDGSDLAASFCKATELACNSYYNRGQNRLLAMPFYMHSITAITLQVKTICRFKVA